MTTRFDLVALGLSCAHLSDPVPIQEDVKGAHSIYPMPIFPCELNLSHGAIWPSYANMWPSMARATVGIRELKDSASSIIDRVEDGEAITVTKRGRPVARIVSASTPPPLAALVAEGSVRASEGPRHLPKPTKLRGAGGTAADYVAEGRR